MTNKTLLSATLALMLAFISPFSSSATVYRVNNNGPAYVQYTGQKVFNDLSLAVAAANAGDTLYIEASVTSYNTGAIRISKKIVLIGPGYLLGSSGNSNLQLNSNVARIGHLVFDPGSENSTISGLYFEGSVDVRASNITVRRNYFANHLVIDNYPSVITNLLVAQNYFTGSSSLYQTSASVGVSSALITNNVFNWGFGISNTFQGVITQNVFATGISFSGNQFYNNIIKAGALASVGNDTTNIHHNIFTYDAPSFLPKPNSNTFNFPAANLFVTNSSTDGNLAISPSCTPCLNGLFGYQMGVYGGPANSQYKLSGIPEIPAIYQLYATPTVNKGDNVKVKINTRSNN